MKSEEGMGETKGRMATSTLLSRSWSHGDILAGICTLSPRGVVFPEEGNGDTAAMPTWAAQAPPQPLELLWKHDTGRAALLWSLIQSLTNGTKGGEERDGHYRKLPKGFCSSSNPSARNMSKCRHSVFMNRRQPAVIRLFPSKPYPWGTVSF